MANKILDKLVIDGSGYLKIKATEETDIEYVRKSALTEEIARLKKNNDSCDDIERPQYELDVACGYEAALQDLSKFLETL